jgi:hypothetical protein
VKTPQARAKARAITQEDVLKIGREYTLKGPTQLAGEMDLPVGRVTYIANMLRRRQVKIPRATNFRCLLYDEAAEILKAEQKKEVSNDQTTSETKQAAI